MTDYLLKIMKPRFWLQVQAGTVGTEVVKQLHIAIISFYQIVELEQFSVRKIKQINSELKIKQLRLLIWIMINKKLLLIPLNGIDKLFLLTLPTPNMTEIASSLIKEAKKNDIKHIVKLSVLDADAEPGIMIGRMHRQEEKIIEESGIPYTFLRAGAFMQNFINFFGQTIKTQNAFYLPAGEGKVSFVDVRDIAAVAYRDTIG